MKYHIITYGCQMNKSDSERIATVLEEQGHKPVKANSSAEALAKADLIVVNMCSVRQPAVDRVYGLIPKFDKLKAKNEKLKTILTGCVLKEDRKKFAKKPAPHHAKGSSAGFDFILDIKDLPNWPKYLKSKENKNSLIQPWQINKFKFRCDYLKVKPKYKNNFSAFVPISSGCNNFCSYCVVPYTRGSLVCRYYKEIVKETESAIKRGFNEIWLLGQNVNDYISRETDAKPNAKLTRKINFAKLLKMVDDIPEDFKFFFTSPHPKNFSNELIETLSQSKKFGKYLNLPVQSGDNETLKKMNRPYTVEQYKNLVKKIREKIPVINLSTDVIVGFPGETKKQFENTVKLFKEIKFDMAYISKYSPRPDTAAFQMKDNIPLIEKKRRYRVLNDLIARN